VHKFGIDFDQHSAQPTAKGAGRGRGCALGEFGECRDGARRRIKMIGPRTGIAIEPDGLQPGAHGAGDIGDRIVADVQNISCANARLFQQADEDSRVGLRRPGASGRDVPIKELRKSAALQISVAVAECEQAVAGLQASKRGAHVGIQIHPVSRRQENLQRVIGERTVVGRRAELLCEGFTPQKSQIVRLRRILCGDGGAQRAHALHAVPMRHRRMVALQPRIELPLGAFNDRAYRPQGVVEVETEYLQSGS
jgi:hypothetical protein